MAAPRALCFGAIPSHDTILAAEGKLFGCCWYIKRSLGFLHHTLFPTLGYLRLRQVILQCLPLLFFELLPPWRCLHPWPCSQGVTTQQKVHFSFAGPGIWAANSPLSCS